MSHLLCVQFLSIFKINLPQTFIDDYLTVADVYKGKSCYFWQSYVLTFDCFAMNIVSHPSFILDHLHQMSRHFCVSVFLKSYRPLWYFCGCISVRRTRLVWCMFGDSVTHFCFNVHFMIEYILDFGKHFEFSNFWEWFVTITHLLFVMCIIYALFHLVQFCVFNHLWK